MPKAKKKPSPAAPAQPEFFTAGRYTSVNAAGEAQNDDAMTMRVRKLRTQALNRSGLDKTAGIFGDSDLGPSNMADSSNIGYYSFEFPVDSMEQPASRPEELRFYRLAYERDPIVGRGIDLHTELPLSKMSLEKPKCSVEEFSDYVFDYFQRMVTDTKLFQLIIDATREWNLIGEAFLFVEMPDQFFELTLCKEAEKALKRGRGFASALSPMTEGQNGPIVGQEKNITPEWVSSKKKQSKLFKKAEEENLFDQFTEAGIEFRDAETLNPVLKAIEKSRTKLAKLHKQAKLATQKMKLAAPPEPPPDMPAEAPLDAPPEGAPEGEGAELAPMDDMGGGFSGGGGGMGGGSFDAPGQEQMGELNSALATGDEARRQQEISDLKRYLHLLKRKKELLEELNDISMKRKEEKEIFSHVVNDTFEGFERIQMLPPDQIELSSDGATGPGLRVMFKPSEEEKQSYLQDDDVSREVKEMLETNGQIPMNDNPFEGSFVIHFARKKSGYEQHGRSILQRCLRTIIYREKLRQVQTTLASRNMTPKTVISAPGVTPVQVSELRAQADEAKNSPDFTIVTNYAMEWNELDAQGRLLSLGEEWEHLKSEIAIGLGFSPEILGGEGLYGGNRIQLEILNTTYTQFRESLADIIENQIFKPIAMLKGFYEMDLYGRPRWIYPKINFSRLALRDSGDLYEMLFNLYSKGSLPVGIILDFLGIDGETVKRQLEDDLFTVNDSKFNEALTSLYNSLAGDLIKRTDIINRISKGMTLQEQDADMDGMEGSGEGV